MLDGKPLIGLAGVVVAVSFSEMNDQVVGQVLPDIAGGLGIGQDAVSWFRTIYLLGYIVGATMGPSMAVIFSPRRLLIFGVALAVTASLLTPVSTWLPLLYGSRFAQGLAEGMIISNLIAVALRLLSPAIRLYGLVFYAMTATMIPALATSLAALWTDVVGDWRFVFLQSLPLGALAGLLIWYGLPQARPEYEKLKGYDWPGVAFAAIGFGALAIFFGEGERFDWFNSPAISICALLGAVFTPLFILREATAKMPLVGLYLLKRRNLAYPVLALIIFIVVGLAASQVPISYLQQVQNYRPEQAQWVTLEIAAIQIVMLPLTAWLLDFEWVDSRVVGVIGLLFILAACGSGMLLSSNWSGEQFYALQALEGIGQPLVVMPLLLTATNALKPEEGPFGSALVNAPRALSEAIGAGLLTLITRWRGALHNDRILDTLGQNRISLLQTGHWPSTALLPDPGGRGPAGAALKALADVVQQQVITLNTIDTYVVLGGLVIVLLLLQIFLPTRTYPPRIALAGQS